MKGHIPVWVYDFAHSVANVPFFKRLLKPLYYQYKDNMSRRRQQYFKDNSLEILKAFDKCMIDNGFEYCLIFGTLLGAIREKGFIPHDFDLDVALFIEDRSPKLHSVLKNNGFSLRHRFIIGDGQLGCEETFEYRDTGVTIDIFYICPAINELPYVCCWNYGAGCATYRETMKRYGGVTPRRIELPFNHKTKRIAFESIEVNIPDNSHVISEFCYGPSYMIPNPNYIVPTEHRVVWDEMKASFEEFN